MRHKISLELFGYWNRRRGKRAVPSRMAIEPADIHTLLPDVFILQSDADGTLSFRLAGTGLCALFGRELKGEGLEELWLPDGAETATRLAAGVLDGLTPGVIELHAESLAGRCVDAEMLLLPLADETGLNRRILGCLAPMEQPYWLALDPIVSVVTASIRVLDVNRELAFLANRPKIEVERNTAIFHSRGSRPETRRFSHLTLIEGGRA